MPCDVKREIETMIADQNTNVDDIREYVAKDRELEEYAFRTAIRLGNKKYVQAVAQDFRLHVNQRYLQYIDETDDADMRAFVSEYGLWVENHLDECEFVIQYTDKYGDVIYWNEKFLKEAYRECKDKGLDRHYFIDCMEIERHPNGRAKFNGWIPPLGNDAVCGLDYANQELYFEGHYTWGQFFEWQWEQDVHADADQKIGWLYILKKPYRHGWNNR